MISIKGTLYLYNKAMNYSVDNKNIKGGALFISQDG